MKLRVPAEFSSEVRGASGKQYAVVNGAVDIPDEEVHDGFWGAGFIRCATDVVIVAPEIHDGKTTK